MAARGVQRFTRGRVGMTASAQPGQSLLVRRQAEFVALAAAADRRRQPRRMCADQPQITPRHRLFQRLQQRVAGGVVDRLGGIEDRHLRATVLRGERELFGQLADLLDHDFRAQPRAFLVRDEGHEVVVRVRAGIDQMTAAALAARFATGDRLLAQHASRQPLGHRALAQLRRATEQQPVREAPGVERRDRLLVHALLPGREVRRVRAHAFAPIHSRRCATACAATTSAGCEASIKRNRTGSALARAR